MALPSEDTIYNTEIALNQAQATQNGYVLDVSDKGFVGLGARAHAQAMMLFVRAVEQAENDAVPATKQDADGTVQSRCSSAALDGWAITYALPSGTPGIFGRKGATISTGGTGVPTCTIGGTLIVAGSTATDGTGLVTVQTTAAITTDGPPNTLSVSLVSTTKGAAANLPVGTTLTWTSPPAGVAATFTLTTALQGGADREEDGPLLARILFRLQNPPRGGTAADYRYWTESAVDTVTGASLGVLRGFVWPQRSGLGSVDVAALNAGTGAARNGVNAAKLLAYLNTVRPVTATVNVVTLSPVAVRIRVFLSPSSLYPYDWNDAGTSVAVLGGTATTVVIANASFSALLRAAIDAGSKPRIQVAVSTAGATAAPYVRQVISYAIAGTTTLTLSSAMDVAPTAGDLLWAGGPIVDTIAAALTAYVDQLGPSRLSGFADIYDPWEADIKIARVAEIVMDARDATGNRFVTDIPNIATNGVQIAVGGGVFASASYILQDLGFPEFAYLRPGGIEIVKQP